MDLKLLTFGRNLEDYNLTCTFHGVLQSLQMFDFLFQLWDALWSVIPNANGDEHMRPNGPSRIIGQWPHDISVNNLYEFDRVNDALAARRPMDLLFLFLIWYAWSLVAPILVSVGLCQLAIILIRW